ncbi:MAG TPA: histidine phosphatase family protein [Kofleriaceae bacterium]|jgi:probable phosphoglycerate mutase|nr:histidine phosphatase family protein [Kofleriaceae bacterium]
MRRILLARHGETAWNVLGRLQGHTDIALNDVGRDQARALAAEFRDDGITAIWTSDLARARETGEIIADLLGLPAPAVDPELRERRFGIFEGLTRDQCATQYPEAWQEWLAQTGTPPGGEPRKDAAVRIGRALARIAATGSEPALVVSHGAVMRLWLMNLLGPNIPLLENGTTYLIDHDGAAVRAELRASRERRPRAGA